MAWAVANTTSQAIDGFGVTTVSPGASAGNVLVAVISKSDGTWATQDASWNLLYQRNLNVDREVQTWWKIADGDSSDDLDVDGQGKYWAISIVEISGLDASTPKDQDVDDWNSNGNPITGLALTPTSQPGVSIVLHGSYVENEGSISMGLSGYTAETTASFGVAWRPITRVWSDGFSSTSQIDPQPDVSYDFDHAATHLLFLEPSGGGVSGTGDVSSQNATISGTGGGLNRSSGTGDVSSHNATASGTGGGLNRSSGTGDVATHHAAVSGTGGGLARSSGTGDVATHHATVSGTGGGLARSSGTGDVATHHAAVSGTGDITTPSAGVPGNGSVVTHHAAVSGTGGGLNRSSGTGSVASHLSVVSGTGGGLNRSSGTGNVATHHATISGTGDLQPTVTGSGAVQSHHAAVSGTVGLNTGEDPLFRGHHKRRYYTQWWRRKLRRDDDDIISLL